MADTENGLGGTATAWGSCRKPTVMVGCPCGVGETSEMQPSSVAG
jgi:hypothetical protein